MKKTYMTQPEKNKVRSYMALAGYNITSLAQAIGMSREMLSQRLSGNVDFGRVEMLNISKELNAPPEDIFFDN